MPKILYIYKVGVPGFEGWMGIREFDADYRLSAMLPPNAPALVSMATSDIRRAFQADGSPEVSFSCILRPGASTLSEQGLNTILLSLGIRSSVIPKTKLTVWDIPSRKLLPIVKSLLDAGVSPSPKNDTVGRKPRKKKKEEKAGHPAADALDWEEAIRVIRELKEDGRYRDGLLMASGCNLGLRISDLLCIRWKDLLSDGDVVVIEQKTGKKRTLRVNPWLKEYALEAYQNLQITDENEYVFRSPKAEDGDHITRQRADQILKEIKVKYDIRSAKVFSTHSLRKTFGRRAWMNECKKGRGDQALVLLCDVFGHSSVAITKRYLGIRQEEILTVYSSLDESKDEIQ